MAPGTGCPAEGVSLPVGGVCAAPSQLDPGGTLCIHPRQTLADAGSFSNFTQTKADGTPANLDQYYFDKRTGMLFLYVQQNAANARGVGPLGSCGSQPGDPACPDSTELDTYYSCPPQGCINLLDRIERPGLPARPFPMRDALSRRRPLRRGGARQRPQPDDDRVAERQSTGLSERRRHGRQLVRADPVTSTGAKRSFLHWPPDREPNCPIKLPAGARVASATGSSAASIRPLADAGAPRASNKTVAQWLRRDMAARMTSVTQWSRDLFTSKSAAIPDIGAMTQICSAPRG